MTVNLTLRGKLTAILALGVGTGLFVLGTVLIVAEARGIRASMQTRLKLVGEVLAANSTSSLAFEHDADAAEVLASLQLEPTVLGARTFDATGRVVASYQADGMLGELPGTSPALGERFTDDRYLEITVPVILDGDTLGVLFLRATTAGISRTIRKAVGRMVMAMVVAMLLSLAFARWLQGLVSDPILELAGFARRISRDRDYAARIEGRRQDEVGELYTSFNSMLEQIQQREVALVQSNQELDQFAYIASHDLREPLRGIHNYATFLIEDYSSVLDAEGTRKLEALQQVAQRMDGLIDVLLQYSRLGRVELAVRETDLDRMLDNVLVSVQIRLEELGVEVRRHPLPRTVCDQVRVAEVFRNLVTNAMKYNDKDHKWVEIGFDPFRFAPQGSGVEGTRGAFFVRDNGIGIREKHLDVVFRIFRRLHGRGEFGGGTGSGLTLVEKIVKRHGGAIWVESEFGKGSTFWFCLGQPGMVVSSSKTEDPAGEASAPVPV